MNDREALDRVLHVVSGKNKAIECLIMAFVRALAENIPPEIEPGSKRLDWIEAEFERRYEAAKDHLDKHEAYEA